MVIISIFLISFLFSQIEDKKLYITIQMMDQVGIINTDNNQLETIIETEMQGDAVNCMDYSDEVPCNMISGCEWMMGMCMESNTEDCMNYNDEMSCNMANSCEWMMGMCMDSMNNTNLNTPHFIVMDETLGYWFVTTIASGYIAQYSLIDNSLIDKYFVGDAPAILTIDKDRQKIYCSRMMPMNGMGDMMPSSESTIIQSLNYSSMGLSQSNISEYNINSPAPHGLAINSDGTEIYTASNTADWIYKINTETGSIESSVMDSTVGNPADQVTQRLKPIQCLSVGNKLFVSCSAGVWYNPFNGENIIIPGSLQMWDSDTMTLIDSIEFGDYTGPWHIKESPISNTVYVVLSGDNLYETEGLASVDYTDDTLSLNWITNNTLFDTLHGIDVSSDGQRIYVSGRGDGHIHIFDFNGSYFNSIFIGSMSMLGGITIMKEDFPQLGDANNDNFINIFDIIIIVNHIIISSNNMSMLSPYSYYASDVTEDNIINVTDVVSVVSLIINSVNE